VCVDPFLLVASIDCREAAVRENIDLLGLRECQLRQIQYKTELTMRPFVQSVGGGFRWGKRWPAKAFDACMLESGGGLAFAFLPRFGVRRVFFAPANGSAFARPARAPTCPPERLGRRFLSS